MDTVTDEVWTGESERHAHFPPSKWSGHPRLGCNQLQAYDTSREEKHGMAPLLICRLEKGTAPFFDSL